MFAQEVCEEYLPCRLVGGGWMAYVLVAQGVVVPYWRVMIVIAKRLISESGIHVFKAKEPRPICRAVYQILFTRYFYKIF